MTGAARCWLIVIHLAWCAGWVWDRRAVWLPVLIAPLVAIAWLVLFLTYAFISPARSVVGPPLDALAKGPHRAQG